MFYCQACRTLRDLVQASVQLQYYIDLHSAGMMEGDRHGLSYDECRRELHLREQGWHELRWRMKIDLKLLDFVSRYSLIEVVGRSLYVFDREHNTSQRASRAVLPTLEDQDEAHWQPIWETFELGCEADRVLTDVSEDLLVLVEDQVEDQRQQ